MKYDKHFYASVVSMLLTSYFFSTGIENESKKLYGVQFHPEVDLSQNGVAMMKNFLYKVGISIEREKILLMQAVLLQH